MVQSGFNTVYDMKTGILAWIGAGYPVVKPAVATPVSRGIPVQEAYPLIMGNLVMAQNPDVILIDTRTQAEFAADHIPGAINVDAAAANMQMMQSVLAIDKTRTMIIYTSDGSNSDTIRNMLSSNGFMVVYSIDGGFKAWIAAGMPTLNAVSSTPSPTPTSSPSPTSSPGPSPSATPQAVIRDVSLQEAYNLVQQNQGNANFVIIDIRSASERGIGFLAGSVNIDFNDAGFQQSIGQLDKNRAYLVYGCGCNDNGLQTKNMMAQMDFREVYHMTAGFNGWAAAGFPVQK